MVILSLRLLSPYGDSLPFKSKLIKLSKSENLGFASHCIQLKPQTYR